MGATVLSSSAGAGAVVAIFGPEVILVIRLALALNRAKICFYEQNAFQDEADSYKYCEAEVKVCQHCHLSTLASRRNQKIGSIPPKIERTCESDVFPSFCHGGQLLFSPKEKSISSLVALSFGQRQHSSTTLCILSYLAGAETP